MGLDSVELVIAVEDEFGIEIPNSEGEKIENVGDLFRHVAGALRQRGEQVDEVSIWTRLVDLIVNQLGVRREEVTPTARFIEDLGID